ncbi:MAG TPA: metallophosphoesterase [Lacunisphaera sp.]|jgi:2',3'-cyclic-nucleotide 2'-phosphodiesterase (5'-nucleotidase family)
MKLPLIVLLAVAAFGSVAAVASESKGPETEKPEALVLIIADQHSAYERTAQFVALVDQLKTGHPGLPLAILLDGDTFEYGNVIARRSAGAIEFAMFAALARRAPTVLNLGNHEPEFYDLSETVRRIEHTGVNVIGNIVDHSSGRPFAPASIQLKLGPAIATIVGLTTDHLSTYRVAVRPSLDLADPVVWAKQNFPTMLDRASLPIVMSHAGLNADRQMLSMVPDGTLFVGAHDHLRFVHPIGSGVYVHSGSWNEYLTLAWLYRDSSGRSVWKVEQRAISTDGVGDQELAGLISKIRVKYLAREDSAIVAQSPQAMSPPEAARLVARLLAVSAGADAAFIGNTTFGSGLPAGSVSRIDFDACVRFDGTICTAEVDGRRLATLLANANQGAGTAFKKRSGEYLVAEGPKMIAPAKRYRIATTDWGARNSAKYFGLPAIEWQELSGPKLKARVLDGLAMPGVEPQH